MSLKKRGAIWHWRKMINGEILARSTKTGDKKLAEQIAAKWESEALKELVVDGTKPVLVHQVIDAFLESRKGTGGYSNACTHMKWWKKLPNKAVKEVELRELQAIIGERWEAGAAQNTIAITVGYWNAMMKYCTLQGWTAGRKLPRVKPERTRIRFLSVEEENRILNAINPPGYYRGQNRIKKQQRYDNADLFVCLMHTGARLTEVMHMTWDQVDFDHKTVLIRRKKGGNDTLLEMSDKLYEVLSRRKAEAVNGFVFPTKVNSRNSYRWFDAALKRAGVSEDAGKITPHTTRHTFASRMLKAGMSIIEVQALLGHKNVTSTTVYLHTQKTTVASRAAQVLNATA